MIWSRISQNIHKPLPTPVHEISGMTVQAGLLTSGSSSIRVFPSILRQWHTANFVSGYSGGPVFDLHEVPFSFPFFQKVENLNIN